MRKYFVSLVCVAAMVGCKKDKEQAAGSGSAAGSSGSAAGSGSATAGSGSAEGSGSAGATAPTDDKAGLTVLDQGSEPRVKLAYKIAKGTKQAFDMSIDMGMDMGQMGGKMKLPSMHMDGDVEFTDVAGDGGMKYKLVTHDLKFVDTPGAAVPAAMINEKLAGVQNMTATGTLAPNGKVSDFDIDMKGAPPEVQQTLQGLRQSYDQMVTQLPDQPVGKGARWQVVAKIDENGIKATQTAVFEVVDISDSTVKLKSTVALSAPAQTVHTGGMSADLKRMSGTGSADMTLDLTKLIGPTTMTLHIDEELAAMGQQLTMAMDMAMKMEPK